MTERVSILLSSAGRRGALVGTLRDAGRLLDIEVRVIATDRSAFNAAGQLADAFHLVPSLNDPSFMPELMSIVEREEVRVIVPTIDPELSILAEQRSALAARGCVAVVSDLATIEICSDKATSSQWIADQGLPVPHQYDESELDALSADAWPLFFKPRSGSSSIGAQRVLNRGEIEDLTARHGVGVVEELVDGPEYTMDCWLDGAGHCAAVIPRRRLATRAGEVSKGVTERQSEVEALTKQLVEALPGARGPITVQAMVGAQGPRFIEINPRFGGGYPLTHEAGATFTAALLAEALGRESDPSWFTWREDLVMLRYDAAAFVSLADLADPANPGQDS